ncbi:MAG: hypothetical protein ACFFDP_13425 [Promethearchaeota archaeon]
MAVTFTGSGTKDDPIQISGVSTNIEAIKAEYECLTQRYGKRRVDWKLERQALIKTPDGRMCDALYIELADGTKVEVWFDITPYFGKY